MSIKLVNTNEFKNWVNDNGTGLFEVVENEVSIDGIVAVKETIMDQDEFETFLSHHTLDNNLVYDEDEEIFNIHFNNDRHIRYFLVRYF